MAWGAIIGAAIQAVPAIMQAVRGGAQEIEGRTGLAGLDRPQYGKALALAQNAYGDQYMPGQTAMYDRSALAAANAFGMSKEAGNPFAQISSIQANLDRQNLNIGGQSAAHRDADRANYSTKLDTAYQINDFAPYAEKSQEYRDMIGAGAKNSFAGVSNLSSIAAGLVSNMNFGGGGADQSKYDSAAVSAAGSEYMSKYGGAAVGVSSPSANVATPTSGSTTSPFMDYFEQERSLKMIQNYLMSAQVQSSGGNPLSNFGGGVMPTFNPAQYGWK